jgi:2-polyprenyl-3-methyl-5-hydroxy-6-metoxy-1,4-benzoquinol methylase
MTMKELAIRLLGWRAHVRFGDPMVHERWVWLRRHLRRDPDLTTLDAGCGTGAFSLYAGSLGHAVVGLTHTEADVAKAADRAAHSGLSGRVRFEAVDLRALDRWSGGPFDEIICCEVIEHIIADRKLVADLADLLKPGGRLLMTTPFKDHHSMYGERLSQTEEGGHVRWGYTHDELAGLMTAAGLEVVALEYLNGYLSQKLTNLYRWLGRLGQNFGWAATYPLRTGLAVDGLLTRAAGFPHASIGMVARRPTGEVSPQTPPVGK